MRSPIIAVLALAGIVLSDGSVLAQRGRRSDVDAAKNGWISSLSEGKQQARKTGKPMMVVLRCVP